MTSLAIAPPAVDGAIRRRPIDRGDLDLGVADETVDNAPAGRTETRLNDDAELDERRRGDEPTLRTSQCAERLSAVLDPAQAGMQSEIAARPLLRPGVGSLGSALGSGATAPTLCLTSVGT